jgi:aminoglycoside phosphotransferase (APT) family kinase protein
MEAPFADEHAAAAALGDFVTALHQEAPDDAPYNQFRGVALAERDASTRDRIDHLGEAVDRATVTRLWDEATATPRWAGPRLWVHGDIHLANLIVDDGRLVAVIDFGDLGAADPAPDLAPAWTLFGPEARATFRAHAPDYDDDTWRRGRGWALNFALMYLADCGDDPGFLAMGRHALAAVLGDEDST